MAEQISPSPEAGEGRGGGKGAGISAPSTPIRPARQARNRARALRRRMTEAEKHLWFHLRGHRLGDYKFRKQAPIGRYVADFVCLAERLVVEVDGGGHQLQTSADQVRDRWLNANGYRVLRFWNNDVLGNIEAVLTAIVSELGAGAGPLPSPPPLRGRVQEGARASSPSPEAGKGRGGGNGSEPGSRTSFRAGESNHG